MGDKFPVFPMTCGSVANSRKREADTQYDLLVTLAGEAGQVDIDEFTIDMDPRRVETGVVRCRVDADAGEPSDRAVRVEKP